jgi:hypothetical protein
MTISLYKASQDVQNKIALCVDEDGVIDTDKLDAIECTFKERAVAAVAVYKGKGHTLDTLKSYQAEIAVQMERENKNQERLKDYLHACMLMTGVDKITSDDGLLTVTLYRDRDESVVIEEGAKFPLSLCIPPKNPEPVPDKKLIKAAILKGEPVQGARIVRSDRLTIK